MPNRYRHRLHYYIAVLLVISPLSTSAVSAYEVCLPGACCCLNALGRITDDCGINGQHTSYKKTSECCKVLPWPASLESAWMLLPINPTRYWTIAALVLDEPANGWHHQRNKYHETLHPTTPHTGKIPRYLQLLEILC